MEKIKKVIGSVIYFLFEICVGMIAGYLPAIIIGLALYFLGMGAKDWIEGMLSGGA